MAWVDYRKAFDSTSHELLLWLLRRLAVPNDIVRCIEHLMPLWKTSFSITSGKVRVRTEVVSIRRGVFQGDSLSPLLFCISLLPLSVVLRNTNGYHCGPPSNRRHKVTHLFYMDDLKIYASGERDLHQSLRLVHEYTQAVGMELGLDKCAVAHFKRGRIGDLGQDAQLVDGSILRHLNAGETYTPIWEWNNVPPRRYLTSKCLSEAGISDFSGRSGHLSCLGRTRSLQPTCWQYRSCSTPLGW